MNTISRIATLTLLAGFIVSAQAADMIKYRAKPGSKMRIEGTSTIHDWTAESSFVGGRLELDPAFPVDPAAKGPAAGKLDCAANVTILVRTFKCSSGSAMDAIMQDTMNAKDFPKIEFKLSELVFKEMKGDALAFDATGDIICHGKTKAVKMPVEIARPDANNLKISGTTEVKMTDFDIQPPAPKIALGAIKTGDEVKLVFEWNVQKTGN